MNLQGSSLSFPIKPDGRGTLATISNREDIVAQSIKSIIETRQGERLMVSDFGLPDFVFDVIDAGFAARLSYFIEQQVKRYEPLIERIKVRVEGADAQRANVSINFTVRGSNVPRNLVFPVWELKRG